MQVIVPSAKNLPYELQNIGRMPPVIYPVNQRIIFDYLYEHYRSATFKVVVFENASRVRTSLSCYDKTKIIELNRLGDLAESVLAALDENIEQEIIINFGDTIVFDDLSECDCDSFLYAEDEISETWTYFEENEGHLIKILDKEKNNATNGNGKLFCGVFKFKDANLFRQCIKISQKAKQTSCSVFYYALQLYSEEHPLKPIKAENWLDIGHADKYYNSLLEVKAREFNHITIDKERGILTKRSDNTEKLIDEIMWYIKIPRDIEYVRPRIFDYSVNYLEPFVSMEYYAYHTLHELYLFGDLSTKQWTDIFKRIRFVLNDFKRYSVSDPYIKKSLEEMYLKKTIQRLQILKKNEQFKSYYKNSISINGRRYKSLEKVIHILKEIIPQRLFNMDQFHIIHGDLCFSNIMIDNDLNFIKLVDPRGKYGKFDIYGDVRYDLAKLFHSVEGRYDYIITNQFDVVISKDKENDINYFIREQNNVSNIFNIFMKVIGAEIEEEINNIELIQALLFLSMIPLHNESIEQQYVMLAVGLDILNRVTDIEER